MMCKCSSESEWINKMWYIPTIKYYTVTKKWTGSFCVINIWVKESSCNIVSIINIYACYEIIYYLCMYSLKLLL